MLVCYALGLAAAFMTAVYMTRMMLYTFHGPNRTGEKEREHLAEAPWVMTGPLVVLGVLSVFGGWFNLPKLIPLGPVAALEHWLEPVVGESDLRMLGGVAHEVPHSTEWVLIGVATLIAVAGIALAFARLKPATLVPAKDALPEHGIERVLLNKYYVDEFYDSTIVQPVVSTSRGLLWRGIDVGLIDGLTRLIVQSKDDDSAPGSTVKMGGLLTRTVGLAGSWMQSGQVGTYAWGPRGRGVVRARRFHLPIEQCASFCFPLATTGGSCRRCSRSRLPARCSCCCARDAPRARTKWQAAPRTSHGSSRPSCLRSSSCSRWGLWWAFDPAVAGWQQRFDMAWIPSWGARFTIGLDGIALMMVLLTTFIMLLASIGSWTSVRQKTSSYYALLLVLTTGMLGVFMSLDLFLFYVMWEMMLVPMYFIVGIWGGERRIYASLKFFIYTMIGSLLMLVGIVYLGLQARNTATFVPDFSYDAIMATVQLTPTAALWLFGAFFLAFAVKVPMFPFHTWLPDAHVEAPTAGSVVLASIMLKLGTFGFLRLAVPLFPGAAMNPTVRSIILGLAVVGIVYGALVSLVQPDFKKLVAYSSVSHLGFVMLGIFAFTVQSVQGALMVMINHGISTGALFFMIGMIYERRHTRLIDAYGGIARVVPMFAALLTICDRLSSHRRAGHQRFRRRVPRALGAYRTYPCSP
jgi:proton-translocating NADH-quinone oxidoreductase chain M